MVIVFVVRVIIHLLRGFAFNFFIGSSNEELRHAHTYLFGGIFVFLLLALFSGGVSTYTVILGIIFGVVTAFSAVFSLQAYKKGPASYTNLLIMSSMILPALSGAVLFNEALSVTKIIGIVLMLIAITLSVLNKNEDKKASLGWLTLSLSAALCVGVVGILQKVHQSSPAKDELMWFLCIAFTTTSLPASSKRPAVNAMAKAYRNP